MTSDSYNFEATVKEPKSKTRNHKKSLVFPFENCLHNLSLILNLGLILMTLWIGYEYFSIKQVIQERLKNLKQTVETLNISHEDSGYLQKNDFGPLHEILHKLNDKNYGIKGQAGDIGFLGFGGEKGSEGPEGFRGAQGTQGDDGDYGITGSNGDFGDEGEIGLMGLSGLMGEKGNKGEIGEAGPIGQSLQGNPGIDGSKGQKGDVGLQGDQGPVGLKGSKGRRVIG